MPTALAELLAVGVPVLTPRRREAKAQRPDRPRALGAGAKRRLSPAQEVLLVWRSLRHHGAPEVVGQRCGVSAETRENLFHESVPRRRALCPANRVAAEKRGPRSEPAWTPAAVARGLSDTFETPRPRPTGEARQRRVSAGKKKRPTLKPHGTTDVRGTLLSIDAGPPGPTADPRLYEGRALAAQFPAADQQGDLAYVGTAGVETPPRKPRGGQLREAQRAANRQKAAVRGQVEPGIRRLNACRLLRAPYRPALGLLPMVAGPGAGLVHLGRILAGG